MKKVAVIGAGYVGLTSAACLAHLGHSVVCGEAVEEKVERLSRGEIPIVEPGLGEIVVECLANGRLKFVRGASAATEDAEFIFLCVPTPQLEDGSADMSYIEEVAKEIGPALRPGTVVVSKSTVPVGSASVVEGALGRDDVFVVSNPEFLREGTAVGDFLHPDRIVIGCTNEQVANRVAALYAPLHSRIMITDPASAETIKYASNAYLATKVSFANAIANLCESVGANVNDVIEGMGLDPRIGIEFMSPGPGWGGSCLPKDTAALIKTAGDAGYDFKLLKGVIAANDEQKQVVVRKVKKSVGGELAGKRIAVWGLTFKANTDDLRFSPAVEIVRKLSDEGASVVAYEPTLASSPGAESKSKVKSNFAKVLVRGIKTVDDPVSACTGADTLVVLTEWEEFKVVSFEKVANEMGNPSIVDARNLLDAEHVRRLGFSYEGIGLV